MTPPVENSSLVHLTDAAIEVPQAPLRETYVDDDGIERKDRRRKCRDGEDPRIGHLFNGFANVIHNADGYTKGYVTAMRQEFAELITSLDR